MFSHHPLLLLLLSLLSLSFLPSAYSDDRTALLLLSSAVGGATLRWNRSSPTPCSWEGVTCNPQTNRVTSLRLPADGLSGQIPSNSIGNLTQLRNLSLRHNSLSGPLPLDLGSCTELQTLVFKDNLFSGELPETLFRLNNLVRLDLSVNNFSGQILPDFNNLFQLRTLYLENNQFFGSIPELSSLLGLTLFNVSFNRLTGPIPSSLERFSSQSFMGNSLSPLPLNPDQQNNLSGGAIAGIAIGSVIALLLILSVCFILWKRRTIAQTSRRVKMSPVPRSPVRPPQFQFRDPNPVIARESGGEIHVSDTELAVTETAIPEKVIKSHANEGSDTELAVTETSIPKKVIKSHGNEGLVFFSKDGVGDFSLEEMLKASAEVLGKGTCGTTYRAYLEGGGEVIVKRLKNVCVSEREFREKVESIGVLDHENLIPLTAYYYNKDEKLLVYDSMPMGNLHSLLHGAKGAQRSALTWEFRIKVALEAAIGIHYLHSLAPNLAHGNIKSSNILITDQNRARVSEFGVIQLLYSVTANLNGYRAPEVVDTRKVSQKADVYSFGILLLELLTGKEPTEALEEERMDLARWVESVVEEKWTIDVFDNQLLSYENMEEQMVKVLHLAVSCTCHYPEKRPPISKVVRGLRRICGESTSHA